MGILFRRDTWKNNWLVADWVMRSFRRDLVLVNQDSKYEEILNDLLEGEKLSTYLLLYDDISKDKLEKLNNSVVEIINENKNKEIEFRKPEFYEAYRSALFSLREMISEKLKEYEE